VTDDLRTSLTTAAATVVLDRPGGAAGLLAGLHRDPATARAVPVESVALPPVPDRRNGRPGLVALLAVPAAGSGRLHPAFGMVTWDLAERRVVGLRCWGSEPPPEVAGLPDDGPWESVGDEAELRDALAALDDLCAGRPPPHDLAARYRKVLPGRAAEWYRALVPGATAWLHQVATPFGGASFRRNRQRLVLE